MNPNIVADLFADVRVKRPLVYHITNYVTVNDCANITLCAGGAPVMADAPEEAGEMAVIADALVLNIGTLNKSQIGSMILAGRVANDRNIPVILDPVGAGATRFRTESVVRLLDKLEITILKGNAGEIGILAGAEAHVRGVDSCGINGDPVQIARDFAEQAGITVVMTGATDIVSNGKMVYMVGAFAAVAEDPVLASAAALAAFGIAGERAAAGSRGPSSFRTALFDELACLTPEDLSSHARIRTA